MDRLRSYLMRKMPFMITCKQADNFIDDYLAGDLPGSQRRIFQWHINLCAECSRYIEEYRNTMALGKTHFHEQNTDAATELPEGIVQAILAARSEGADRKFDVFRSSPPFRGLKLAHLENIYSNGEILELGKGALLIEEGKANANLYVVLSGEFKISLSRSPDRGSELELANRRPPDCLGEYTFIDHKLASANVTATKNSELFKVHFHTLEEIIASDAELSRAIYRNILLLVIDRLRANDVEIELFNP